MNEYLNQMFGTAEGYVYMAYKAKDESWQERHFQWPSERRKLAGWVRVHRDANLFIVPALRGSETRKKGDGINLRWLWADVDWEKIPAERREVVRKRIDQLGTYVVRSGSKASSGDYNVHVYVRLAGVVEVDEHYRLNTGLRDYLYADNKQADNSFLRLPGTTNWKTARGSSVRVVGGHGKAFRPASLGKLQAFQKAARSVAGGAGGGWNAVDVKTVPQRARRLAKMQSDEAVGRYGTRHKAVWAVVGDLHRLGLTEDQIHTLMDQFPPAEEKKADEHGAYDVHKDIDRRLAALRHAQAIVDGEDTSHGSDDGSPFEELSDDEIRAMGPDNPMVKKILARRQAVRDADAWEAQQRFIAPPDNVSWSAADRGKRKVNAANHLIKGVAGAKHNVVITAQYKTGKTAFTVATLAKSLVDGEQFLGELDVPTEGRIVGHWNCEMDEEELWRDYVDPAGMAHPDRFHVANLRGYGVNLLSPVGKAWTVQWLRDRGVQVWTIDSLARLLRMAGVKEQENDAVLNVLMAIDEIKVEAGVDVCFVITHTGRAEQTEGNERARGATVIDDWADARWVMTRVKDDRFLSVEGRGVGMKTTVLDFNEDTKASSLGIGDKHDVRANGEGQTVLKIVQDNPGILKEPLTRRVCTALGCRPPRAREVIADVEEAGFIRIERVGTSRGGRASQKHWPNEAGPVRGGATKRTVDFRRSDRYAR